MSETARALSGRWKRAAAAILICAATAIPSRAQSLTTLVTFNGTNGAVAESLVLGTDGNFYGTTSQGGASRAHYLLGVARFSK
jgi:hypothetical protein